MIRRIQPPPLPSLAIDICKWQWARRVTTAYLSPFVNRLVGLPTCQTYFSRSATQMFKDTRHRWSWWRNEYIIQLSSLLSLSKLLFSSSLLWLVFPHKEILTLPSTHFVRYHFFLYFIFFIICLADINVCDFTNNRNL